MLKRRPVNRRWIGVSAGAVILIAGLAVWGSPLHVAAQNNNPCGTLWSDGSADANGPTASQDNNIDLVSGNMSDNGTSLTTILQVKSLSSTPASDVPSGATAVDYYMVWAFNGTQWYTDVDIAGITGTITYSYGTYNGTTFTQTATVTGLYTPGTNGKVGVIVPFSDIGNPATGDAFGASGIFGESTYSETISGNGVVFTTDKDASTYDYVVGQSCGSPTPTPSPTAPTATPTLSPTTVGTCTAGNPELNVSENGFICPVEIPGSAGLGEPTIIHDDGVGNNGVDRLFVTGPAGVPTALGSGNHPSSPLWTSTNGGTSWTGPVYDTFCASAAGGDTDLAVDTLDNVFETDLWLGNSCLGASDNHGGSFCQGNAYGSQVTPGDDRPWLAYDSATSNLYATYDGETSINMDATLPTNTLGAGNCPSSAIQAINHSVVVGEVAVNGTGAPGVRECVCPPGGDTVDNSGGTYNHRIYVSYSYQGGTEVSYNDPTCTTVATVTSCIPNPSGWTQGTLIADSTGGSAFQDEWNFSPIKVDGNGTVYVMWSHAVTWNGTTACATTTPCPTGSGGVQEYYAYSTNGGANWSSPVLLSTENGTGAALGTLGTTTFPTMDVVSPGAIDVAWYGTTPGQSWGGDPNQVPGNAVWNIYYARVTGANTGTPSFTPEIAVDDMHHGCIQTGGNGSSECSDRSLLDFFTLIDDPGSPQIIYTDGDVSNGVNLFFTDLVSNPTNTPEVPWAPLLLVPAAVGVALTVRRGRRRITTAPPQ